MNNEYLELKKELEENIEERNQLLLSKMTSGGKKKLFSKELFFKLFLRQLFILLSLVLLT